MPANQRRPIRILELRSVRGTGGGPEKTILLGTAATDPARFAITVCYIRDRRDAQFEITGRAASVGIDYVEIEERHSLDPAIWPALRRLVRSRQIDIVHAHEYKTDMLAYMLAKVEPVIPLATVHGWTGHSSRERAFYYPADKTILARYPQLIAVSGDIRRELIRWGARPDGVEVVLNGIDERTFCRRPETREHARARFGVAKTDIVIGAVGRLEPQKRFDLLMAAFDHLRPSHPHLRLLIAGEGSLRRSLEEQIRQRGLQQVCRLVGLCHDIIEFHHAIDFFVQSSIYEGTPNVVLEAMALGTPVTATDVGGTAELLRDRVDGLIVPPMQHDALVSAIDDMVRDRQATDRRVTNARARIETDLSFRARMDRVEAVYERLIRQGIGVSRGATCSAVARS